MQTIYCLNCWAHRRKFWGFWLCFENKSGKWSSYCRNWTHFCVACGL